MSIGLDFGRPAAGYLAVGSGWGPRGDHTHRGLDIAMREGTPILSVADGTVTRADPVDDSDAGKWVAVRHPGGWTSRYLHLSRVDVRVGDAVRKGQQLGLSGNTGRSSGPHLHFELRLDRALLPQLEAAVGKPTTGWGTEMSGLGVSVPAEPWIPVDEVRTSTIVKSHSYGIPFHSERARIARTQPSHAGAFVLGAIGIAAVAIGGAIAWRRRR